MNKKIQCLQRLFDTLGCRVEIFDFLKKEKIISEERHFRILNETASTHASTLFVELEQAKKEEKIQLLDYEWSVLPVEQIKLTIVTTMDKLELSWKSL